MKRPGIEGQDRCYCALLDRHVNIVLLSSDFKTNLCAVESEK